MKKKIIILVLAGWISSMNINAQVFGGDTWVQLPTRDIYSPQIMDMSLQHAERAAAREAEMEALRQAVFEKYCQEALDAYYKSKWDDVINNVNIALKTKFYNGDIYFMRGYAYEQKGNYSQAKKDYKMAKKYESSYQIDARLEALKEKKKRK